MNSLMVFFIIIPLPKIEIFLKIVYFSYSVTALWEFINKQYKIKRISNFENRIFSFIWDDVSIYLSLCPHVFASLLQENFIHSVPLHLIRLNMNSSIVFLFVFISFNLFEQLKLNQ